MNEVHVDITEMAVRLLRGVIDPYRQLVETLHAQGRLTPAEIQALTDAVRAADAGPRLTEAALPRLRGGDPPSAQ